MELNANGPRLIVADQVDENGAIDFELCNDSTVLVYGALTVNQAAVLAKHLTELVKSRRLLPGVKTWDNVRITETSHKDLLGGVGVVVNVFDSGNLQVLVGSEYLVVAPSSVEVL